MKMIVVFMVTDSTEKLMVAALFMMTSDNVYEMVEMLTTVMPMTEVAGVTVIIKK